MSGHLSLRPTWTSPSRVDGPAWPCTGRGLPGRRVTATPVRSYRTISPLPVRDSVWPRHRPCHFCGTFPRVSPGGRYPPPCPVVSGLSSRGFLSPRGPLGPPGDGSSAGARAKRAAAMVAGMRTAVVTGAGSGLGRAIAAELIGRGYRVHVTDVDAGAADRVAAELGPEARGSALDVRDEAACRGLADSIGRTGSLDLWVNNAGVFYSGPPWEQSAELRQTMLDVNVTGLMNGTVAALGPMRAAGRGPRRQRRLPGRHRRRAGRGRLLGQQARGDGLHAGDPVRPAPQRREEDPGSRPSARRDLDADARGQARRPRRRPVVLRSPPHRRGGGAGGRQADRAPAPDPDRPPLARPRPARLSTSSPAWPCGCCRW